MPSQIRSHFVDQRPLAALQQAKNGISRYIRPAFMYRTMLTISKTADNDEVHFSPATQTQVRLAAFLILQMGSCVKRLGLELAGESANLVIVSICF